MYNIHEPSTQRRTVKVLARTLRPLDEWESQRIRAIPVGCIVEAEIDIYPGLSLKHENWLRIPEGEVERVTGWRSWGYPVEINNKLHFQDYDEPGVKPDAWAMITDISPENPFGYWNKIKASRSAEAYA